jgi:hypothetical protein
MSAILLLTLWAAAQAPQPPVPPPPPTQVRPAPRDQRLPAQTGTSVIRGRVLAGDTGRPLRRAVITVTSPALGTENRTASTGLDGRYEIKELPAGRYTDREGRDITDTIVELGSGEELGGVQIVLTDKLSTVSGQLVDQKGAPLADGTVLVFADDPQRWTDGSRWVASARPDQRGRYQFRGLPSGAYLAIALDNVEDGSWNAPFRIDSASGRTLVLDEAALMRSLKM